MTIDQIIENIQKSDQFQIVFEGNIEKTVSYVLQNHKNQKIAICGSFYIMAEAKKALGFNEDIDAFELNELKSF